MPFGRASNVCGSWGAPRTFRARPGSAPPVPGTDGSWARASGVRAAAARGRRRSRLELDASESLVCQRSIGPSLELNQFGELAADAAQDRRERETDEERERKERAADYDDPNPKRHCWTLSALAVGS